MQEYRAPLQHRVDDDGDDSLDADARRWRNTNKRIPVEEEKEESEAIEEIDDYPLISMKVV